MRLARTPSFLAVLLLAVVWSRPASGDDINWTNTSGGFFTDGGNWSTGQLPGPADNSLFNLNTRVGYTVTIPDGQQISNDSLQVGGDQVTLLLTNTADPTSYTLAAPNNSFIVGQNPGDDAGLILLASNPADPQSGFFAAGALVSDQPGSNGHFTIGTSVNLSGSLTVGNGGTGSLAVNYGSLTYYNDTAILVPTFGLVSADAIIGNQTGSIGSAVIGVSGGASGEWTTNGNASIAAQIDSTGNVSINNGLWLVSGDINVGGGQSATGGTATLNVNTGGYLNYTSNTVYTPLQFQGLSDVLRLYKGGTVNLNGGEIVVGSLDNQGGTFNFNSGTLAVGGSLDIGAPGDLINNGLNLTNSYLIVSGNTDVNGQLLQINGGGLSTGSLTTSNGGSVQYIGGELNITNDDLTIGPGQSIGSSVTLVQNGEIDNISVSGLTTIAPGGVLTLNSQVSEFSTGTLSNSGTINFLAGNLQITNGGFTIGAGQPLGSNLTLEGQSLNVAGQTTINPGASLTLSVFGNLSSGSIANNGNFSFNAGSLMLTNSGLTVGNGGLLGSNVNLNDAQFLFVSGATTVNTGSSLTLAGAYFQTGQLSGSGNFSFQYGQMSITNGDLTIGPGQLIGSNLNLTNQEGLDTFAVSGRTIINPGGTLTIAGGTFSTGTIFNQGTLNLNYGSLSLTNSDLNVGNGGLFGPDLNIGNIPIEIGPGIYQYLGTSISISGQTIIQPGSSLTIDGGAFGSGSIVNNGTFSFTAGSLGLRNSDLTIGPGGLLGANVTLNNQTLQVSGQTSVVAGSVLTIINSSLYTGGLVGAGQVNFVSGTLIFPGNLVVGSNGLLGPSVNLTGNDNLEIAQTTVNSGSALSVDGGIADTGTTVVNGGGTITVTGGSLSAGPMTINTDGVVNLSGGSLEAASISGGGSFSFTGGALTVDKGVVAIGPSGLLGPAVTLGIGESISLRGTTLVQPGGTLSISGGSFSTGQLSGEGGSVSFATGSLTVGGGLEVGPGSLLGPSLALGPNQTLNVGALTNVAPAGSLSINGGTLTTNSLAGNGNVSLASGQLDITRGNMTLGASGPLGSNVTLAAGQELDVGGTTTINPGSSLTIAGGSLKTSAVTGGGALIFNTGIFSLTGSDLTIGPGGLLGSNLVLDATRSLYIYQNTTIAAGSTLTLTGGTFTTNGLTGGGQLLFNNGSLSIGTNLTIGPGGMFGSNLILGPGKSLSAGNIIVAPGGTLSICGGQLGGGNLDLAGTLNVAMQYNYFLNDVPINPSYQVTLGGILNVSISDSYQPNQGDTYYFLQAFQGVIIGQFANAPEGTVFDTNGRMLQINYQTQEVALTDIGPFVPEPCGGSVLAAGAISLLIRNRKKASAIKTLTHA